MALFRWLLKEPFGFVRFRTEFRNYGKKKDFGKTIPRNYQQHKLKEWRDLTFIMKGIYSSMQRNEKCFAANQLYDAAKRLYNFAANRLHYAAKQLVAKRPDTI